MKKFFIGTAVAGAAICAAAIGMNVPVSPSHSGLTPKTDGDTDITATYIVNPSFETDNVSSLKKITNSADGLRGWELTSPSGWTVEDPDGHTSLLVDKDCYADNNFGLVTNLADGNYAYYLRMGWSTGDSKVSQTLKNLPAGNYRLTVDERTGYANSAVSSMTLTAAGRSVSKDFKQGSNGFMASEKWNTLSLSFSTASQGDVEISVSVQWVSGGSCVMLDNFRLYSVSGENPDDPTPVTPVESYTEGVITHDFVPEAQMKDDLLQMLADFSIWMKNDFQECESPNSKNEACGCFKGESTMANNEAGVRTNADLSMICAFLVKYGKGKVTLPTGVTWADLEGIAKRSLVFAYSTHKANKLKVCSGNNYWGSTSKSDSVWESSLWAMSVAYSAFFQWDSLTQAQKDYIKAMLVAECNYELERTIPTGYAGDTKAEENGWEADILAATLGMFPDHQLASKWFDRLREFAINSYSHIGDASDATVIDPDYDKKTVADLYKGKNLYDDYTLQNHNLFHTSYQNVVMQELGEAALALKLFQTGLHGTEKWKTNALMHNNQKVMDNVLNWLALADGELAMPNGNDWSLFLFDQITSYSTMACFLKDPNALMLENMAYKFIQARQKTTGDGSWLLRPDVGARRMGVEAHRVMMSWLMHEVMPTASLTPTKWDDFNKKYSEAKVFGSQNVVRGSSDSRFTCFSWSTGLSSYTGYIASTSPDKNKIVVPFRANNTGNFLGWYTVTSKGTNATPVVSGIYDLKDNAWTMNGELNTNDAALNNRFAIYSTPGNAVIYVDYVRGNTDGTVKKECGGLMAISVDPFMKEKRTLYYGNNESSQSSGTPLMSMPTEWVNIDNELGVVAPGNKGMAFGDRGNVNSIQTAKLYSLYSNTARTFKAGDMVDRRVVVYYSRVDAPTTKAMLDGTQSLGDKCVAGWNGVIAPDPDGVNYLLLANFVSDSECYLKDVACTQGAPVFPVLTEIAGGKSSASFITEMNHSISSPLKVYVKSGKVNAVLDSEDSEAAYISNPESSDANVDVAIISGGQTYNGRVSVKPAACVRVSVRGGTVVADNAEMPSTGDDDLTKGFKDVTSTYFSNPGFEEDKTYGAVGSLKLGSVTYDPCYVNEVAAVDSKFPNILPVKGWVAANGLEDGSNYCRMYSMPYSTTMFCVSPSTVGNYAAQCSRRVGDTDAGERCLTVLNSWAVGSNAITQTATLPAGKYRVLIDVKYECPGQESNDGTKINAGGNVNTSLIGVKYGKTTDYRYPSTPSNWETLVYDIDLTDPAPLEISLGYKTSKSIGAASNTLLYADKVRLLRSGETGVSELTKGNAEVDVYSVDGICLRKSVASASALENLPKGIYLVGGKKVIKR